VFQGGKDTPLPSQEGIFKEINRSASKEGRPSSPDLTHYCFVKIKLTHTVFCDLCAIFETFVVKIRQSKLDKALPKNEI